MATFCFGLSYVKYQAKVSVWDTKAPFIYQEYEVGKLFGGKVIEVE